MDRVQLDELTLINFRNLKKVVIHPSERFNIVSGRNGMGKTNLIEAIYLVGSLRSFRTSIRRDLIHHGETAGKVSAVFGQISAGIKCEITIEPEGRVVCMDGKRTTLDNNHFRTLPMVLFHPGNMDLVQGGPEFRRRFIDRALFQANVSYPSLYRAFVRALGNRNKILKKRPIDKRALIPFDIQIADLASRIVQIRSEFVQSMNPFFQTAVFEVSGGNEASLVYKPKFYGSKEDFIWILEQRFSMDSERGYTTVGPHADDLLFEIDGKGARKFASQGQQRTLVLSAKIAETKVLTQTTGRVPLLLLDDVSSELDKDRNSQLFSFLSTMGGQVFITTTHHDHIPIPSDRLDFYVDSGTLITM